MIAIIFCILLTVLSGSYLFAQGGGNSLGFDGINDWLNCGTNALNITDSLTIEAWVKADNSQPAGYARILDKYNWYAQEGFNLTTEFPSSGGSVMLDFWATDGAKNSLVGATQINDDQWHHVVATYDANAMKIYIDGQLESQNIIGAKTIKPSSNFLGIGNNSDGAVWFPFNGQIDQVRLWNTALDSVTLKQWMHKRLTSNHPASGHLVGYWKFNEGAGATAADSSSHGNHGSLTNMDTTTAWLSSTVPLATSVTETLDDLSAVWVSKVSGVSSILSIQDTDISSDDAVLFGHDNAGLTFTTADVPANLGVQQRLERVWRLEAYGVLSGEIIFDVKNLAFTNGTNLRLLFDSDGVFTDADTAAGIFNASDSTFRISNHGFQHGYYYTLGTEDAPASIDLVATGNLPQIPVLKQNYPNPFNPGTTIRYYLPQTAKVLLRIYNILGVEVLTLINEQQTAGEKSVVWEGRDRFGKAVSSGVYILQLRAGNQMNSRKMLLVR